MKASLALGWKALVSKINPPLPLNSRDSQKLLSLLTDSFRQQLDKEHSSFNQTNVHIDSILSNPLFKSRPAKNSFSTGEKQPRKCSLNGRITGSTTATALEDLQFSLTDPVAYFQNQVATGSATLYDAIRCLKTHAQNAIMYQDHDHSDKSSVSAPVGSAILHWLWSSGMEESMEFIYDWRFLKLLMPVLIVEKKETQIWQWLICDPPDTTFSVLNSIDKDDSWYFVDSQGKLLNQLISKKTKYPFTVNDALISFTNFVSFLRRSSKADSSIRSMRLLQPAARTLLSKILVRPANTSIDAGSYELFTQSVGLWSPTSLKIRAMLSLYHPIRPDPSLALKFFERLQSNLPNTPIKNKRGVVQQSLDAAQLLLLQKRDEDAKWVLDFIQDNFRTELGENPSDRRLQERRTHEEPHVEIDLTLLEAFAKT